MKKRFRISPLLLYRLLRTEMLCRYIEQCRNTDTTTERNPRRSHFGIENCSLVVSAATAKLPTGAVMMTFSKEILLAVVGAGCPFPWALTGDESAAMAWTAVHGPPSSASCLAMERPIPFEASAYWDPILCTVLTGVEGKKS